MTNDIYTSYDVVNADLRAHEDWMDKVEQMENAYNDYLEECARNSASSLSFEEFVEMQKKEAEAFAYVEKYVEWGEGRDEHQKRNYKSL